MCPKMGAFFINSVAFTSNLVYSVVWNQSPIYTYWDSDNDSYYDPDRYPYHYHYNE